MGIRFGFQYRLIESPAGQVVPLRGVWQIPAPGITNPVNGNIYCESARDFTALIGDTQICEYGFDQPWEIVEGEWVCEFGTACACSRATCSLFIRPEPDRLYHPPPAVMVVRGPATQ